ncbi:MAG: sigma 54-interacting transcriptional regulator [Spirochaetales bacterium]|nr:sigma 54-interacting transcriptional regulator [Spirochaetales bacterium]
MPETRVLLSFVGNRDPYVETGDEHGPLLSLLQARQYDLAYLFCTGSQYLERANMVAEAAGGLQQGCRFEFVTVDLDSPIDYVEILSKLKARVDQVVGSLSARQCSYFVLLDPGTPQMQTAWFLLAKSRELRATLLQGIPPRFAGGAYKVREVDLESEALPEVRLRPARGREAAEPGPPESGQPEAQALWVTLEQGERIIGQDPEFRAVLEAAHRVAAYDVSVLIRGETGTGKELVARFIHEQSARAGKPYASVNCAAVGASLAESELFGHLKGAFTGADRDRPGKFRSAAGGTILLDEIGDLPLEIQPKLLRVLESRTLVPVGADREVAVDVRILAATNQDLEKLIAEGRFRRDLYERLNQVTLRLPALRERRTDIPILVQAFLGRWNLQYKEDKGIGEDAMGYLMEYPWPGNIRELRNSIISMCAMANSGTITPQLLPPAIQAHFHRTPVVPEISAELPDEGLNLRALLYQVEREFFRKALRAAEGNKEQAAHLLGVNAPAFRKALRERFEDVASEWAEP